MESAESRQSQHAAAKDAPQRRTPTEIALGGYAAWNSGDLETFLDFLHPEILWVSSGVFPGLRPSYSGHEGMHEFWSAFLEPWETLEIEIDEIYELDEDSLLISARFHARGRQGIVVDRGTDEPPADARREAVANDGVCRVGAGDRRPWHRGSARQECG